MIIKVYEENKFWVGLRLAKSLSLSAMRYVIVAERASLRSQERRSSNFWMFLTGTPEIDRSRVEVFHLDEYIVTDFSSRQLSHARFPN